jgi:hypothetical protein
LTPCSQPLNNCGRAVTPRHKNSSNALNQTDRGCPAR